MQLPVRKMEFAHLGDEHGKYLHNFGLVTQLHQDQGVSLSLGNHSFLLQSYSH